MKKIKELDRLFNPSSLAMVGASNNKQKGGGLFLKALIDSGFNGKLYPVNPRESEVMGLRSYHSVLDIPGEVDLAYVTVPARTVPQVMAECGQKGIKFAVVHSAGFSELGAEGKELEEEMLKAARQNGTRIIGPNCMGLYSPRAAINTITPRGASKDEVGPVAFVGQSGWVTENVIQLGYERGLRFSKVVSIGNQSDLTIEDMLEYFASDTETRVIAFYIEGIKRGRELLRLARQTSRKKPIIIWKAGSSEVGAKAAASHTGSLAGNNVVIDAALTQGGITIARNLEELIDLMAGFASPVLPAGNRVGLLVESGGGAVAGADAAQLQGLEIPPLTAGSQRELADRLKGVIPPFSSPRNPVDLVWTPVDDKATVYLDCARIILNDNVDAIIVVAYADLNDYLATELANLRDSTGKPVLIIPGHSLEQKAGISLLTRRGIPAFTIPERAIKALSAMVRYSNYRHQR